ncbi:uncharacterized protein LOC108165719 isoform X2 [Poecilia reticulata]|uniref:uncharacterized protein LOC108165719 isoform X2 n=1 Tax=Poecilia reticulata TaxID=8081 RepID=UPI0007EB5060|nr:PREDICTED: uncharacterized protein LOC108165719 isoform X2 [Poecilia reticulata]
MTMKEIAVLLLFLEIRLFAAEVHKNLTGIVGERIPFDEPVWKQANLLHGVTVVAEINKGELEIFSSNISWNNETRLFMITLQKNDSGIYTLHTSSNNVTYYLKVYNSPPVPKVNTLNVSSDNCILQCSADKEATLRWYKNDKMVNESGSAYSLDTTVKKEDQDINYICMAFNPASNKTHNVNVKETCSFNNSLKDWTVILITVGIVGIIGIIGIIAFGLWIQLRRNKEVKCQSFCSFEVITSCPQRCTEGKRDDKIQDEDEYNAHEVTPLTNSNTP